MELVLGSFIFVKLVACCFFTSWNLHTDFSPRKTGFIHDKLCVPISFVGRTKNKPTASSDFCFWTCAYWFFFRKTCCRLIFLFVELCIDFSPWKWSIHGMCSKLIYDCGNCCVLIFVRETCCKLIFKFVKLVHCFFLVKLNLFMEHAFFWFLFVKQTKN